MNRIFSLIAACLLAGGLLSIGISKEVPIGQLSGRVTMEENGKPLPHALVVVTPERTSDEYDWTLRNWHVRTSADGSFSIRSIPAGEYRMEVVAKHHSLKDESFTVSEGQAAQEDVRLAPGSYELNVYASQHVLPPHQAVELETSGFVKKPVIDVELRKLKESAIIDKGGVEQSLQGIAYQHENLDDKHLSAIADKTWSDSQPIKGEDIEGSFEQKLALPPLDEGLYLAVCRSGDQVNAVFLNVSKIALIEKTDPKGVHCFVTDIESGLPIPHAQLLVARKGRFETAGKTGTDGLAIVPAEGTEGRGMVMARVGNSFGICGFRAGSNTGEGDGDGESAADANTRIFTYADRPVYKPGDTINFKAVIRHLDGNDLHLPGSGTAKVEITDPDESLLQTQTFAISRHGTIYGSFATSPEAAPGVYQIHVHAKGGVEIYYANLAAYRKPDYSIKVTPTKKRYCIGDTASATVDVQYFFGGPVVGAKITASVYRSPDWSSYWAGDDQDDTPEEGDEPDDSTFNGGEYSQEVKAVTDGTGHATISFPTVADSSEGERLDYNYSIQVAVEDEDGRSFEGSGSVSVTRGNVRLSATTDPGIVSPGEHANLILKTTTADDPVAAAPNRPVTVSIEAETWTKHTLVHEALQTLTVNTGADGTASVPLSIARTNDLVIKCSSKDDQGHTVEAETYLSVEGAYFEFDQSKAGLKAKLDRKKYKVGDTLKAMISTGSPGGMAYLTIQADDIKLTRLVSLKSGSTMVKLKVDKAMAPNAYLHVAYVRDRHYWDVERAVRVNRQDRHLEVSVQASAPKALPGSDVAFTVRTKDEKGRGVPAEVSLGVVDESIYTIKRDSTDIVSGLYPSRSDEVETTYSFPEIYLDGGDKGGGSVPVRRKFLDTASWSPVVETDSTGEAKVTVKLPDNLTSWRATAVAATDDSRAGMATANIRASKPLMVRIEPPQFMVATDSQKVAVAVTNDSGSDNDVDLRIKASGLTLGDSSTNHLHLSNGETSSVLLDVTAPSSGTGDLVATATSTHGESDAVDVHFPILPHGRLVVDKKSGTIEPDTNVEFQALPNRDTNTGSMELSIAPSVLSGMMQSLDGLVQFPYGCVEQTMSRFLPAVMVTHALHSTTVKRPDLDAKAKKIAADGFARLKKMQHSDGAWGWWTYDESDPFMTAWVLDGLKRADRVGYPAPANLSTESAVKWALDRLKKPFKDDSLSSRLYLAYSLAQYDHREEAKVALEGMKLGKASLGELGLAVLAAQTCGASEVHASSMQRVTARLAGSDIKKDAEYGFWGLDEGLALALLAVEETEPNDPIAIDLVRRLLKHRRSEGWESTRGTSLAVAALCDYIEHSPESLSPSTVEVDLNGSALKTVQVDPADPDSPDLRIEVPVARLANGPNHLSLKATGGRPFYSFELRQYDVQVDLPKIAMDRDFQVDRAYYRLEPRLMPDGTKKLLPSDTPISVAHNGDIVRCEITIRSKRPMQFLMIEDPVPSNFRVTDREDPGEDEKWSYWWSSMVIRDDRVSLFARYLPSGVRKLSYVMRAEGTGTSCALPTHAEDMYQPEEFSSGASATLEVKP